MAKTLSVKNIRFILIATFVTVNSVFFSIVFHLSQRQINADNLFSERAQARQEALNLCREALNAAQNSAQNFIFSPNPVLQDEMELKLRELRGQISNLPLYFMDPGSDSLKQRVESLQKIVIRAQTAAFSAKVSLESAQPYRELELEGDNTHLLTNLSVLSDDLQTVFRVVSDDVFSWQKRTVKFHSQIQLLLGIFFIAMIVFSLAVSIVIERLMRRSLLSLSRGTKELRTGNLNYRFKEISPDEIGEVKYDFNMMARKIEMQSNDLRRANEELRSQAEKLIEAHQHKDRFLSNMSHELRTPLNSIIGFSELLLERAEKLSPDKIKSYSQRVLTAASHLLELITGLLDLAKSGAGTLKPVFAEFDLSFTIRDMIALLRPMADKKGLYLNSQIEENIHLNADARMIKQIFLNLVSNAIKFTKEGGVQVRLHRKNEHEILLEVEDSGIGVPEAEQANLFKDFYRADNAEHVSDGVGIGLALSRRLAELNHGTVSFTSTPEKGSVFSLTLKTMKNDTPQS